MSHIDEVNVSTVFEYNGKQWEFDIADADTSDTFERAVRNMEETSKAIPKTGKSSDAIRAQCKIIKNFFDDCFGAGAGEDICTAKDNVSVCYNAYAAFLELVKKQKDRILGMGNVFSKYSNRAQRRAAAKEK